MGWPPTAVQVTETRNHIKAFCKPANETGLTFQDLSKEYLEATLQKVHMQCRNFKYTNQNKDEPRCFYKGEMCSVDRWQEQFVNEVMLI